jgi:pimeloyl-ACP methyl ester carboxylesterase
MVAEAGRYDRLRMRGDDFVLELPGGRRLEGWARESASTTGLLFHLGTPCAGVPYEPVVAEAAGRDLRFVTYSRPGYGGSTRCAGRTVADCCDDVVAIAGSLGLERLHVVGWSGGGPHALACAALLPELVVSTATLAGVAPWDAEGLDWTDGMADENLEEFGAAAAGPEVLEALLESAVDDLRGRTGQTVAEALGGLVTDVDRAALTGELADYLADLNREAVANGPWGWIDDDLAFIRDWGFSLAAVATPVTVWQGRQDAMVPYAHGEWLARHVSGARPMLLEDEGHISLVRRFDDVVEDLLSSR